MPMETEKIIIRQQQENIAALEYQRNNLQEKVKELTEQLIYIKSACLQTTLEAGEQYRNGCRLDISPLNRCLLALQYRDYLFIYSRMYKNSLTINDDVMKDINYLTRMALVEAGGMVKNDHEKDSNIPG